MGCRTQAPKSAAVRRLTRSGSGPRTAPTKTPKTRPTSTYAYSLVRTRASIRFVSLTNLKVMLDIAPTDYVIPTILFVSAIGRQEHRPVEIRVLMQRTVGSPTQACDEVAKGVVRLDAHAIENPRKTSRNASKQITNPLLRRFLW